MFYSQPDWHHPDYRNGAAHAKYIEYLHGLLWGRLSTVVDLSGRL